jgi:hypothetical protein
VRSAPKPLPTKPRPSFNVYLSDTKIAILDYPENPYVELWKIRGVPLVLFPNKIVAEQYARNTFPDEDPEKRYGRIFFRRFVYDDDDGPVPGDSGLASG